MNEGDDVPRFAVCTFQRVFDVEPAQDALTLQELVRGLTRFELKPSVLAMVERDLARADAAWEAWQKGEHRAGHQFSQLQKAAKAAEEAGEDVEDAVRQRYEQLRTDAKRRPKRELRLWSPALYEEGTEKRGSEFVRQLSCLVLDYDDGTRVEEARAVWDPWFHIMHTTWSHTPEHHKFRIILPLSHPVDAADWGDVWSWAETQTGRVVDPTMKGAAAMFALPVVPNRQWPRAAYSHAGPLLDPVVEGLVEERSEALPIPESGKSWFREPADATYIEPSDTTADPDAPPEEDFEIPFPSQDDADGDPWHAFDEPTAAPVAKPAPAHDLAEIRDLLAAVMERLDQVLEHRPTSLADELERLEAMHERGFLTDDELAEAKKRSLEPSG